MKNTVTHRDLIFVLSIIFAAMPNAIAAQELPSMEFLEYLGEWETQEGEWIDPATMVDTEVTELKATEFDYTAEEQSDEQ